MPGPWQPSLLLPCLQRCPLKSGLASLCTPASPGKGLQWPPEPLWGQSSALPKQTGAKPGLARRLPVTTALDKPGSETSLAKGFLANFPKALTSLPLLGGYSCLHPVGPIPRALFCCNPLTLSLSIDRHTHTHTQSHAHTHSGRDIQDSVGFKCPCMLSCFSCDPTRLLCPWNSPDKNTGVGCHALLQGLFPTQGSNPDLLHLLH